MRFDQASEVKCTIVDTSVEPWWMYNIPVKIRISRIFEIDGQLRIDLHWGREIRLRGIRLRHRPIWMMQMTGVAMWPWPEGSRKDWSKSSGRIVNHSMLWARVRGSPRKTGRLVVLRRDRCYRTLGDKDFKCRVICENKISCQKAENVENKEMDTNLSWWREEIDLEHRPTDTGPLSVCPLFKHRSGRNFEFVTCWRSRREQTSWSEFFSRIRTIYIICWYVWNCCAKTQGHEFRIELHTTCAWNRALPSLPGIGVFL